MKYNRKIKITAAAPRLLVQHSKRQTALRTCCSLRRQPPGTLIGIWLSLLCLVLTSYAASR